MCAPGALIGATCFTQSGGPRDTRNRDRDEVPLHRGSIDQIARENAVATLIEAGSDHAPQWRL